MGSIAEEYNGAVPVDQRPERRIARQSWRVPHCHTHRGATNPQQTLYLVETSLSVNLKQNWGKTTWQWSSVLKFSMNRKKSRWTMVLYLNSCVNTYTYIWNVFPSRFLKQICNATGFVHLLVAYQLNFNDDQQEESIFLFTISIKSSQSWGGGVRLKVDQCPLFYRFVLPRPSLQWDNVISL